MRWSGKSARYFRLRGATQTISRCGATVCSFGGVFVYALRGVLVVAEGRKAKKLDYTHHGFDGHMLVKAWYLANGLIDAITNSGEKSLTLGKVWKIARFAVEFLEDQARGTETTGRIELFSAPAAKQLSTL